MPRARVRPDLNRPREFLEQFSLDTLRMVGTLRLQGRTYGLVQTRDGLVHRVLPGNHLGQSDGRIIGHRGRQDLADRDRHRTAWAASSSVPPHSR